MPYFFRVIFLILSAFRVSLCNNFSIRLRKEGFILDALCHVIVFF